MTARRPVAGRDPRARSRRLCFVFLLTAIAARESGAQETIAPRPLPAVATARWRFFPGLSIAYDSFGQRYSVTDDDTLDFTNEANARVHTILEREGRTHLRFQNMFGYGPEAVRNDLVALLESPLGRNHQMRLEQELRYKGYTPNSDFTYSSDYLVGTTRGSVALRPGRRWRLRFDDRFEWAVFDSTDRYNYDYRLNDGGAEIEREYGLLSSVRAGYAYGTRVVPDSSEIDYRRHVGVAGWEHDFGLHGLGLQNRLERRRYGAPEVRSHFWDYSGELLGRIGLHPRVRLRPEYRGTVTRYDRPDSIWSNYSEQSAEVLLEGDPSPGTTLAFGPRAEFRRTSSDVDRPYNQWSFKGGVTYMLGSTLWLQFTEEIGVRRHFAGDDFLYTDYTFNWSTLFLSWQPVQRLAFDLFFSLSPESHEDKTNDTTTLLLSTSLTYGWR